MSDVSVLSIFRDPHPEEILYGTIARTAEDIKYPDLHQVNRMCFGDKNKIATVAFPSHLHYLIEHLPSGTPHTVMSLIEQHTLLPLFMPFLPAERVTQVIDDMTNARGMSLHMRIGTMASTVPMPSTLRFCPRCADEDMKELGEWCWRRLHQAPGVLICPIHRVWLEESLVGIAHRKTRHAYVASTCEKDRLPRPRPVALGSVGETLLAIAEDVRWLLENILSPVGLERLQQWYIHHLIDRDLATYRGRVRMSELQDAFAACYPHEVLALLHCSCDSMMPDNWLARLVRKPQGAQHPLRHLLLLRFFGKRASDLQHLLNCSQLPFGKGPWPCLNPVCPHYLRPTIFECDIAYFASGRGQPSGTFACTCGFVYARMGLDHSLEDRFRRGKIIAYGIVWENELKRLWKDGTWSLNAMAHYLKVDPLTIKRQAIRFGLVLERTGPSGWQRLSSGEVSISQKEINNNEPQKAIMRQKWIETGVAHPGAGVKRIREIIPSVYMWLYRHDRTWQREQIMSRMRYYSNRRVDWEVRDRNLAEVIPEVAQHLLSRSGPPMRLTIATIGREIGQLALIQQHIDRLPLTASTLSSVVENHVEFAIRRIWWAVRCFEDEIKIPKKWELIRRAGVGRFKCSKEVEVALGRGLERLIWSGNGQ